VSRRKCRRKDAWADLNSVRAQAVWGEPFAPVAPHWRIKFAYCPACAIIHPVPAGLSIVSHHRSPLPGALSITGWSLQAGQTQPSMRNRRHPLSRAARAKSLSICRTLAVSSQAISIGPALTCDQHLTASSRLRREHRNSIKIMARSPLPGGFGVRYIEESFPIRIVARENHADPAPQPFKALIRPIRPLVGKGAGQLRNESFRLPSPLDLAVDALGDCFRHGLYLIGPQRVAMLGKGGYGRVHILRARLAVAGHSSSSKAQIVM